MTAPPIRFIIESHCVINGVELYPQCFVVPEVVSHFERKRDELMHFRDELIVYGVAR